MTAAPPSSSAKYCLQPIVQAIDFASRLVVELLGEGPAVNLVGEQSLSVQQVSLGDDVAVETALHLQRGDGAYRQVDLVGTVPVSGDAGIPQRYQARQDFDTRDRAHHATAIRVDEQDATGTLEDLCLPAGEVPQGRDTGTQGGRFGLEQDAFTLFRNNSA